MSPLAETIAAVTEDGYAVRPLLGPHELESLRALFDPSEVAPGTPVFRTIVNSPRDRARAVDIQVKSIMRPRVASLLPGFETAVTLFVLKAPQAGSAVAFHQDWSLTDERAEQALMLWISLDDSSASNGGLAVVPGSHRWVNGVRPLSTIGDPTDPHQAALADRARSIDVPAGSVVVYHPALVHGSTPNLSTDGRLALLLGAVPEGARQLHYVRCADGVFGFEVDDAFYTSSEHRDLPQGYPEVELWGPVVSDDDLGKALNRPDDRAVPPTGRGRPSAAQLIRTVAKRARRTAIR